MAIRRPSLSLFRPRSKATIEVKRVPRLVDRYWLVARVYPALLALAPVLWAAVVLVTQLVSVAETSLVPFPQFVITQFTELMSEESVLQLKLILHLP